MGSRAESRTAYMLKLAQSVLTQASLWQGLDTQSVSIALKVKIDLALLDLGELAWFGRESESSCFYRGKDILLVFA